MDSLNVGSAVCVEYVGSDDSVKEVIGTVDNVMSDRVLIKVDGVFDTVKSTGQKKQSFRTIMVKKILNVSAR